MEREFTITEAAQVLGVSRRQMMYAMNTRRNVERRIAGHMMLVTLTNARKALDDVDQRHSSRASRASA